MNQPRRVDHPFVPASARLPAGDYLERAAFVAFMAVVRGGYELGEACRSLFPEDPVSPILLRAAVSGATTSTTGWAAELAEQAVEAFLGSLAPASAASRLMPRGITFSFGRVGEVLVPGRTSGPVAAPWAGEGAPIAVRASTLANATLLPRKLGAINVFSHELARLATAENIFRAILREDAAITLDSAYFSTIAGSATEHAGLLNGVTPSTGVGSTGASLADAIRADLAALASAVSVGGGSGEVMFVMGPGKAAQASIAIPDLRSSVLPSTAVPEHRVIAVDPASLIHGFGPEPDIEAANGATIHMSDTPAQIVSAAGTVAAPVQSIFQTAQIALRMLLDVAFAKRRVNAVAYADNIEW